MPTSIESRSSGFDSGRVLWTKEQRALVVALLDEIIPAFSDGRFPSAATLPVLDYLVERSGDVEGFAALLKQGVEVARTTAEAGFDGPRSLS